MAKRKRCTYVVEDKSTTERTGFRSRREALRNAKKAGDATVFYKCGISSSRGKKHTVCRRGKCKKVAKRAGR